MSCKRCPKSCHYKQQQDSCVDDTCQPGCGCPPNKVYDDGKCIEPFNCKCIDLMGTFHEVSSDYKSPNLFHFYPLSM